MEEALDEVNGGDEHGVTPLIRAVSRRDVERCKELLERGADVNKITTDSHTAVNAALLAKDLKF